MIGKLLEKPPVITMEYSLLIFIDYTCEPDNTLPWTFIDILDVKAFIEITSTLFNLSTSFFL